MIKLKGIKKKLLRLEASMQKDAKKLAKLKRKVEAAMKTESGAAQPKSLTRAGEIPKTVNTAPKTKKVNRLTPAGRDRLSAIMKARWAARRAAAANGLAPGEAAQLAPN